MIPLVLQHLINDWQSTLEGAGVQLTPPLQAIQLGGSTGVARKINFLVFNHGESAPCLLLKTGRQAGNDGQLRREYASQQDISAQLPASMTVPRPIGTFTHNGRLFLIETAIAGSSLTALLYRYQHSSRRWVTADLQRVQRWLRDFQAATRSGTVLFEGKTAVSIQQHRLSALNLPAPFWERLHQSAQTHTGLPLPQVGQHGDFWPGNIFFDKANPDSIGVIDWEEYQPTSTPFRDLFLFITTYVLAYPWSKWRRLPRKQRFEHGFFADNWQSAQVKAYIHTFWQQYEWPLTAVSLFFTLFLCEMAAPVTAEGKKRLEQSQQWRDLLLLYTENADRFIFSA